MKSESDKDKYLQLDSKNTFQWIEKTQADSKTYKKQTHAYLRS